MKALFIGGTGNISRSCTTLAAERGIEVYVLNRGKRKVELPANVKAITGDIKKPEEVKAAIGDMKFDVVANFIAFTPEDIERDLDLFEGRCGQYIFISSASAYQKPVTDYVITESTPLANPWWQYSRNKIACEERLIRAHRETSFPAVTVRPSHTYDTVIPVAVGNWDYSIVARMKEGKPVILHGDGTSLWVVTHSEDFAKGFVGLMGNPKTHGHAFHITSDEVHTWRQIYEIIGQVFEVEPKFVSVPTDLIDKFSPDGIGPNLLGDKAWSVVFDNTKIKTFVPGFQATITFAEGMRRTRAWFDADESRKALSEYSTGQLEIMDKIIAAREKAT